MSMSTRSERDEQGREVGVVTFGGREFRALGASVDGRHITGYIGKGDTLTTWDGRVTLAGRSSRVGEYRTDDGATFGIVFYLPRGRAVVGYALGVGGLFRGELVYSHQDAERECRAECLHWLEADAEDAERWAAEGDDVVLAD